MQPVAYSYTDVNFDSDVWVCLDVDISTLAEALKSYCNHLFHEYTPRSSSAMAIISTQFKVDLNNEKINDGDDPIWRCGCSQ